MMVNTLCSINFYASKSFKIKILEWRKKNQKYATLTPVTEIVTP